MGGLSVLLDAHALLWWLADDRRLTRRARQLIADSDTTVYVSAASVWEIAMKVALGTLDDRDGAVPRLPSILVERGMVALPTLPAHAIEAARLPLLHRDPFDRMLVAQGRLEHLVVVTNDERAKSAHSPAKPLVDADQALQRYLSLPQQPGQPTYADANWRRGMIAERRNNVADARSACRRALQVNPQHAASREALARLGGPQ